MLFDEETLKFPVFPLTVKYKLLEFVDVPLYDDNVKLPFALFTFVVCVVLCVLYPALLALTVTVNDEAFVIVGIVGLYVVPSVEYSSFASLGFVVTLVNAL